MLILQVYTFTTSCLLMTTIHTLNFEPLSVSSQLILIVIQIKTTKS